MGIWGNSFNSSYEANSGIYTGREPYTKFGRAINIPKDIPVDIWNGPTDRYNFTGGIIGQAGVPYYISSSSALDLQNIVVSGIDENGFEQTHIIALNGQNKIRLGNGLNWFRFWRGINSSGIPLNGDIYIYEDTTVTNGIPDDNTKIRGYIASGDEITQLGIWTMPINEKGTVTDILAGIANKVQAVIQYEVYARPPAGVFALIGTISLNSVGAGVFQREQILGREFPSGSDFLVTANSGTIGVDVIIEFSIERRLIY